ncbi:MAG: hypothetical protein E6344_19400 [Clostridium sp.]|uniref:hypothetical protein n=1 Tax=Clostridium culturomicium TaxID=1499683 RepID=UPI000590D07D|nr:hypothetical protein [Clostridium culturomicium]MDU4892598.1 hypothetical protein [Clostridium sp.]MDU7085856.1 hypothetical protein [Clostridium sp.]
MAEYSLTTIEVLQILDLNPTYRAINPEGHTLELRGPEKFIIHRRVKLAKDKHVSLNDNWRIIKPISYEIANDLFKKLRTIEIRFNDGTKKYYSKLPENSHIIIESDLPHYRDCLFYCFSYSEE